MRDTERDTGRDIGRGRKDAGFDPRIPGSQPEPKADAQPLNHPGTSVHPYLTPGVTTGEDLSN